MLSKHPDKCRFPHGHTRRIEFVLEANVFDGNDMVCDFKAIKEAVGEFVDRLDHAMCMNVNDPMYPEMKQRYGENVVGFAGVDPTTEVLARHVYDYLQTRLRDGALQRGTYPVQEGVRVRSVRIWETSSSWAEYRAESEE